MKYLTIFFSLLACTLTIGCSVPTQKYWDWTPAESAYLVSLYSEPTTVTKPNAAAGEAWDRGLSFIERFSALKVTTASTDSVATEATKKIGDVAFSLARSISQDSTRIHVQCGGREDQDVSRFERALARYIRTGEEPVGSVVAKVDAIYVAQHKAGIANFALYAIGGILLGVLIYSLVATAVTFRVY